jgi:hypothetical protein
VDISGSIAGARDGRCRELGEKGSGGAIRLTQLSAVLCKFPPEDNQPVHHGNPCRLAHESFRPTLRDTNLVLFSVKYDKCDLFLTLWQF